jgi:hypothetical protein
MRKSAKIKLRITMVEPAVLYGSETWPVTVMDMKRVNTWERKLLRRIYGPVVEEGIREIRTSQELRELQEDFDIVEDTEKKRLECLRHLVRMDDGRVVKVF